MESYLKFLEEKVNKMVREMSHMNKLERDVKVLKEEN